MNVGIKRVMEGGIETVDGKVQELDVIVCATGMCYRLLKLAG